MRATSRLLDVDRLLRWEPIDSLEGPAMLRLRDRIYRGLGAVNVCLLVHPATFFVLIIIATQLRGMTLGLVIIVAFALTFPLTAWVISWLSDHIGAKAR